MSRLDQPTQTLLDLLLELQHLDRVPRTGYLLRGIVDPESVAEHTFHVALLVLLLADREAGLDGERALRMALLHDVAEVRTGDLPRPATKYLPDGAKKTMESGVLADLFAGADGALADLLEDYLAGESAEARFVRACDRLQLAIKAQHYDELRQGDMQEFFGQLEGTGEWPSIDAVYASLRARRSERRES